MSNIDDAMIAARDAVAAIGDPTERYTAATDLAMKYQDESRRLLREVVDGPGPADPEPEG